jgi:AcrR family transcriptional regulator
MSVGRPRNRERTTDELTAAARELVEERNYETIRVRDVAERVGCNHGLITQYFGTKLGLFTAVLHSLAADINAGVTAQPASAGMVAHPVTATYWRLLAALLEAGLDPAEALVPGSPAIELIIRRASELSGTDLEYGRPIAGFAILMAGGFHVFGETMMHIIAPSGDPAEAVENFRRALIAMMTGVAAEAASRPVE